MLLNFVLINGVSFLFYGLLQLAFIKHGLMGSLPYILVIFSFPHFIMTYWIWQERVKVWKTEWWPLIFPLVYAVLFYWVDPAVLVKISYAYLLYHFAQQLFGTTMWLNHHSGISVSKLERGLIRGLFLSGAFYALLDMELRGVTKVLFYYPGNVWNFPPELIYASFVLTGILFCWCAFFRIKSWFTNKSVKELNTFGGLMVAILWFIPPFSHDLVFFIPIIHAVQYYPFVFMKKKSVEKKTFAAGILISIAAGWVMFRWLPFHAPGLYETSLWAPFVITLLNNHHFIIDGRIWKLRDPSNEVLMVKANQN